MEAPLAEYSDAVQQDQLNAEPSRIDAHEQIARRMGTGPGRGGGGRVTGRVFS